MTKRIHSRIDIIIFLVLIFIVNQSLAFVNSIDEKENIVLNWAFCALVGPDNNRKLIPITKDTLLKTGDQLKMLINKKSECFVYLIYHGSNGEIMKLFPNNSNNVDEKYFIPQGDSWFFLDEHTGKETFYLLVSKRPLTTLENLVKKYEACSVDKKSKAASQIIEEINRVIRLRSAEAERPAIIGGVTRNPLPNNVESLTIKITATDFYSRIFTIDHK